MVDAEIVRRLLHTPAKESGLDRLSTQERRVLDLMAQGYSNRGIASTAFLSERTVEGHIGRISVSYTHLDVYKRQAQMTEALLVAGGVQEAPHDIGVDHAFPGGDPVDGRVQLLDIGDVVLVQISDRVRAGAEQLDRLSGDGLGRQHQNAGRRVIRADASGRRESVVLAVEEDVDDRDVDGRARQRGKELGGRRGLDGHLQACLLYTSRCV